MFELSAALDQVEERIVSDAGGASERATLGVTRRSALRLAREIAGLRSPLLRLEATLSEPEHDELRETGARLAHRADILARDLGEVQDRARLLQDELNAMTEMVLDDRLCSHRRDDAAAAGDFRHGLLWHEHAQSSLRRRGMGHGLRLRPLRRGGARHVLLHAAHGADPPPHEFAALTQQNIALRSAAHRKEPTPLTGVLIFVARKEVEARD